MTSREVLARAEARVGTVVRGKYRIDRVLGVGGMAVVYEVTHRNQKRFALKMLHVELSLHEDVRRRFLREGYAANTVDHPGAVVVIDDETAEDGSAFLVMELLDGRPLDELLDMNERRLPAEAVLSAAEQTLEVLIPAHAKGIVHRDIKPANLFALRDGALKVLDFGIARLRDLSASSQATHTGVMLGTPAYMPPEQALSQPSQIDAKTDVWAVGATMFTLLSGANVHKGQTATQILVAAASQRARSVTSVAPWVDERISEVVAKALAFEKADRWASAAEMRDAVRKVHEEIFGAPPSRAALAALVGSGQRTAANPDPFVVSDAKVPASDAQTVQRPEAVPSPGAQSVTATPPTRGSSVGFSTAKPVSSGGTSPKMTSGAQRSGVPWLAVAIGVIGAVGLTVAMWGSGAAKGTTGAPSAIPAAIPIPTPTPTPTSTPSSTPTSTPTSSATPTPTSSATASASASTTTNRTTKP